MPCRTGLAVVSLVLVLASSRPAGADGCFVRERQALEADLREPLQKALIVVRDGREDLVLSVRFEGASREFGWIVPLPAPPEMCPEDPKLFEVLSWATLYPEIGRSRYRDALSSPLSGVSLAAEATGVEVIQERTVGIYRTAVLRATAGDSLATWLATNGFQAPPGGDGVFGKYIEKGWVFAAMKIDPGATGRKADADLRSGTIQPIRFRFPVEAPVFPLEISALNPGETEVLLYVIASDALVPADRGGAWRCTLFSAERLTHIPLAGANETASPLLPDDRSGLTLVKCRATFAPEAMRDVAFRPYDADKELNSKRLEDRLQALTYLGRARSAAAGKKVLAVLAGRPDRAETETALWALGGIGGAEARAVLIERARPGSEMRTEALDALRRLGAREALPVFVKGMDDSFREDAGRMGPSGLSLVSFEALIAYGDESCIEGLRAIALRRGSFAEASRSPEPVRIRDDPHRRLVLALAACGDGEATTRVVESIVRGSKATEDDRVEASKPPPSFWRQMERPRDPAWWSMPSLWPVLGDTVECLAGRKDVAESILWRARGAPGLSDIARIILVANLRAPNEDDFRELRSIWSRAVLRPVRTVDVQGGYNYKATAVVSAFLHHERYEDLLRLRETAPADDATLRVELVRALAASPDPGLAFPLEYLVQRGDSYWRIAESFYGPGNGKHYLAIAEANGDAMLRPGQSVRIPPPPGSRAARALASRRDRP